MHNKGCSIFTYGMNVRGWKASLPDEAAVLKAGAKLNREGFLIYPTLQPESVWFKSWADAFQSAMPTGIMPHSTRTKTGIMPTVVATEAKSCRILIVKPLTDEPFQAIFCPDSGEPAITGSTRCPEGNEDYIRFFGQPDVTEEDPFFTWGGEVPTFLCCQQIAGTKTNFWTNRDHPSYLFFYEEVI